MGVLYLIGAKIGAIGKMIAMKKCGNAAKGAKNSLKINLIRSLGCVFISLIICVFIGFQDVSDKAVLYSVSSGIANALLLFAWVLCAERCALCTVEIFCMIGGVVLPMILAPLMFSGESVSIYQWIGALMLIPAAYCFFPKNKGNASFSLSAIPLLLLSGLSNAGCVISQKLFTAYGEGTVADFNLITFVVCTLTLAILFVIIKIFKKELPPAHESKSNSLMYLSVYIFVAIVMLYASQFLNTLASGKLSPAIFYPLSYAISMPMTLLTDIVIFKEKIRTPYFIGISLVIGAIILINL